MFEAYSVGVRISVINGAAAGLLGLSRQFKTAGMEAAALNRQIAGIKRTLLIGGGMAAAGLGILSLFKPALDQAKQFQIEATKFSLYGMGDKANAEATKFAKSMGVIGSSYVNNMRLINEAQGIFRESGGMNLQQQLVGAKIAAPILAKLGFIESSMGPEKAGTRHTEDLAMLRFVEAMGGANDPSKFASIADWGFKLSKSSGGVVPWSQLQRFIAGAGTAGFNLGLDDIAKLEPVIADLTGGTVGSGLRVAHQRLLGIQRGLPKQAVNEYLSLGLWDRGKVELTSGGSVKRFLGAPGSVLNDADMFAQHPVDYYTQKFLPAIQKKYGDKILGDSVQARTMRAAEISLVFGPGNAGKVFSQVDKLMPAISRSVAAQRKELGIDASAKAFGDTLMGKQIRLQADYENIMESMGEVVLPMVIKALNIINPMLEKFATWSRANPGKLGLIVDGLVGLGGALTVIGSAMVVTGAVQAIVLLMKVLGGLPVLLETVGLAFEVAFLAITSPVGLAVAGLTALGLAIWGIVAHWDKSKSVLGNIKSELGLFFSWVWNLVADLINKVPGMHVGRLLPGGAHFPTAKDMSDFAHGGKVGASPYVAPGGHAQKQSSVGDVLIDGHKAGKVIWRHQNAAMGRVARSSAGDFDPTQSLSPVSMGYAT